MPIQFIPIGRFKSLASRRAQRRFYIKVVILWLIASILLIALFHL